MSVPADYFDMSIATGYFDMSIATGHFDMSIATGYLDMSIPAGYLDMPITTGYFPSTHGGRRSLLTHGVCGRLPVVAIVVFWVGANRPLSRRL